MPPVRPSPNSPLTVAVDAWLFALGATKPSPRTLAAYRSDVEGVAGRIDPAGLAGLRLEDLDKGSLRTGFASWAADHAASSVLRAHSAWTSLFDYLVAEDLADGNPMAAVPKPRPRSSSPKAIQAEDAATRLLATAAQADTAARHPWPERDLALIATFLVTGIRAGEAEALGMASIAGPAGARHLQVTGKGNKTRSIPVDPELETLLNAYLATRQARQLPGDLDHPSTPLFVDHTGRRLASHQIRYLVERLYTRAGIRSRIPAGAMVHALRHTFATDALQAGADVVELQTLLGHASLDTTRRYLDASAQGLRHVTHAHPAQQALRAHLQT